MFHGWPRLWRALAEGMQAAPASSRGQRAGPRDGGREVSGSCFYRYFCKYGRLGAHAFRTRYNWVWEYYMNGTHC